MAPYEVLSWLTRAKSSLAFHTWILLWEALYSKFCDEKNVATHYAKTTLETWNQPFACSRQVL